MIVCGHLDNKIFQLVIYVLKLFNYRVTNVEHNKEWIDGRHVVVTMSK